MARLPVTPHPAQKIPKDKHVTFLLRRAFEISRASQYTKAKMTPSDVVLDIYNGLPDKSDERAQICKDALDILVNMRPLERGINIGTDTSLGL